MKKEILYAPKIANPAVRVVVDTLTSALSEEVIVHREMWGTYCNAQAMVQVPFTDGSKHSIVIESHSK